MSATREDYLSKPDPGTPALTVREARSIGDLLGQHDAGIEMLSIKLSRDGDRVRATFRTPLGTFDFADCQIALAPNMASLIDTARRKAGPATRGRKLETPPRINADSFERPKRKIYFED